MHAAEPENDEVVDGSASGEEDTSRWVIVLMIEGFLLLVALVLPVMPSKTGGSTWSPAELIWPDPSYLQDVAASFVLGHVLLAVIAVAGWIALRLSGET